MSNYRVTQKLALVAGLLINGVIATNVAIADCTNDSSVERRLCSVDSYSLVTHMGDHGHGNSARTLSVGPNNHDILIHTSRDGRLHTIAELSFYDRNHSDIGKNVYKARDDYYRINVPLPTFDGAFAQLQQGNLQIVIKNRPGTGITASLISAATDVAGR